MLILNQAQVCVLQGHSIVIELLSLNAPQKFLGQNARQEIYDYEENNFAANTLLYFTFSHEIARSNFLNKTGWKIN